MGSHYTPPAAVSAAAATAVVTTSQATASASYVDLATVGPSVTVTVPASGNVLVEIQSGFGFSATSDAMVGVAVSGANTSAADSTNALYVVGSTTMSGIQMGTAFVLTGLTPGATTFKLQYRTPGAVSVNFNQRRISVQTLP